jgi:hypothetical protein
MRHLRETVTVASTLGSVTLVLVTTAWIMPGYSFAGERVVPQRQDRVASTTSTAEDHRAAALLYQQGAKRARTEANRYIQTAASIRPIEDPKGFRRSALMTAAQEQQQYAREVQQLYVEHQTRGETKLSKQQPQEQ